MVFYLGTHNVSWLAKLDIPLFISHRRLSRYRTTLPKALGPWALDSGGFSELSMYGEWRTTPAEYVKAVRRYRDEIGNLQWAAIQDFMTEAPILAKTGLTLREHQRRTVGSYLTLMCAAPDLPWVPVVQGQSLADYLYCVKLHEQVGIQLQDQPIVGLGSVCRRQSTAEIGTIVKALAARGLKLHDFGIRAPGLRLYKDHLVSADSMAWSMQGRHIKPCSHSKRKPPPVSCSNCLDQALLWRNHILETIKT